MSAFEGKLRQDIVAEQAAAHSFDLPTEAPLIIRIVAGEGHPELRCEIDRENPRCKGQENEEFDVYLNGSLIASHRDLGPGVNAWIALEPVAVIGRAGSNELLFRHTGKPGSPGSVGYRVSVSIAE